MSADDKLSSGKELIHIHPIGAEDDYSETITALTLTSVKMKVSRTRPCLLMVSLESS